MKKFVFLSILCLASSSLAADDTKSAVTSDTAVKLEGLFNFQSGFRQQNGLSSSERNISRHNRDVGFYTEATLSATVAQCLDELKYGAKIVLMPTTNISTSGSYNGSHIFVESNYGKVEAGSPYDAGSKMRVTAYDIVAATGDDFSRYANLDHDKMKSSGAAPEFAFYEFFLDGQHKMKLDMPNDKTEPARKISYFTPVMSGFQFGVSYIPDSSNAGVAKYNTVAGGKSTVELVDGTTMRFDKNVKNAFSAGVSYTHQISDGVAVKLAATGEYGKSAGYIKQYSDYKDKKTRTLLARYKLSDLRTYNVGAVLTYGSLSYALSYGDLGKSLTSREYNKVGRNTQYYNGAVAYTQGPIKTSVSYFKSKQFKNNLDAVSIGTEYKLGAGLLPYAEVAYFQAKGKPVYYPNAQTKKTKGTVAILGAKLKF